MVNRIIKAPEAIISTISALSEMLGKPNIGSPSGTTSIKNKPFFGGISPGRMMPLMSDEPDLA